VLKLYSLAGLNAKAEALAYLEAKARAAADSLRE